MQAKIQLFSFIAAVLVVFAKLLVEQADKDGNIYIKTPKQLFREVRSGYVKFKEMTKRTKEKVKEK